MPKFCSHILLLLSCFLSDCNSTHHLQPLLQGTLGQVARVSKYRDLTVRVHKKGKWFLENSMWLKSAFVFLKFVTVLPPLPSYRPDVMKIIALSFGWYACVKALPSHLWRKEKQSYCTLLVPYCKYQGWWHYTMFYKTEACDERPQHFLHVWYRTASLNCTYLCWQRAAALSGSLKQMGGHSHNSSFPFKKMEMQLKQWGGKEYFLSEIRAGFGNGMAGSKYHWKLTSLSLSFPHSLSCLQSGKQTRWNTCLHVEQLVWPLSCSFYL